jgi:hypothetical protein
VQIIEVTHDSGFASRVGGELKRLDAHGVTPNDRHAFNTALMPTAHREHLKLICGVCGHSDGEEATQYFNTGDREYEEPLDYPIDLGRCQACGQWYHYVSVSWACRKEGRGDTRCEGRVST